MTKILFFKKKNLNKRIQWIAFTLYFILLDSFNFLFSSTLFYEKGKIIENVVVEDIEWQKEISLLELVFDEAFIDFFKKL